MTLALERQNKTVYSPLVNEASPHGGNEALLPSSQEATPDARQEGTSQPIAGGERDAAGMDGAKNDADKGSPPGIPTGTMARALDGLNGWSREKWSKNLASTPGWLSDAKQTKGKPGAGHPATWDPVAIVTILHDDRRVPLAMLDTVFNGAGMRDWKPLWETAREYLAMPK